MGDLECDARGADKRSLMDLGELGADHLVEKWEDQLAGRTWLRSPNTQKSYRTGLARFLTFAFAGPDECSMHGLTRLFLSEQRKALFAVVEDIAQNYAKSTFTLTISATKHFAAFLHLEGEIPELPTWPSVRQPESDFDPPHYSPEEQQALVTAAATPLDGVPIGPRVRSPLRDSTMLTMLIATGMRAEELITFDVGWLVGKGPERVLTITGKGQKKRSLPIGAKPELLGVIDPYLEWRKAAAYGTSKGGVSTAEVVARPFSRESPVFVTNKGERFTYGSLRYLYTTWLDIADWRFAGGLTGVKVPRYDGTATLHACRHTAAINLVGAGVALNLVQAYLGHSSIAVTSAYLKVKGLELTGAVANTQVVTADL